MNQTVASANSVASIDLGKMEQLSFCELVEVLTKREIAFAEILRCRMEAAWGVGVSERKAVAEVVKESSKKAME